MPSPGIVDSHAHVHATAEASQEFRRLLGGERPSFEGDVADALTTMDALGVRKMVLLPLVRARTEYENRLAEAGDEADPDAIKALIAGSWSSYNTWARQVAREQPDRFAATIALDPVLLGEGWARKELERGLEEGAVGIKLMPAMIGVPASDERMRVVWEFADRHRLPVVSQSGLTPYTTVSHPDNFEPVAASFPHLKLILAHAGLGAEERTIALTDAYPNVYVDTSAWFDMRADPDSWLNRLPGEKPYSSADAAGYFRRIGIDRVLFGTNYAIRDPYNTHACVQAMGLNASEQQQLYHENYARVFDDWD